MPSLMTAINVATNDLTYFPVEVKDGHCCELWINHGDYPHALMLSMDIPQENPEMVEAFMAEAVEDIRDYYEERYGDCTTRKELIGQVLDEAMPQEEGE